MEHSPYNLKLVFVLWICYPKKMFTPMAIALFFAFDTLIDSKHSQQARSRLSLAFAILKRTLECTHKGLYVTFAIPTGQVLDLDLDLNLDLSGEHRSACTLVRTIKFESEIRFWYDSDTILCVNDMHFVCAYIRLRVWWVCLESKNKT